MSMTRRERLLRSMRGEPVDRPPVSFYEINGYSEDPTDSDSHNVFSDPSWQPLLDLAREKTDRMVFGRVGYRTTPPDPLAELTTVTEWEDDNGSRHSRSTIQAGSRTLTTHSRRDPDINTSWCLEHLLKDLDDFKAWLDLPIGAPPTDVDPGPTREMEREIGETGLVILDTCDPLCMVAPLFSMEDYTIIALTEPELFKQALDKCADWLLPRVEAIAEAMPGYLWRIYGPEYASPPYLPPRLFAEYVVPYVREMTDIIHRGGGYVRVHSHGRLKSILDHIASTGCDGLDPIEPPNQGDVSLAYVRQNYGRQLVLFGNLEISDIETMPTPQFAERVQRALDEGTAGDGRGFVLMPSAAPYGRIVSDLTMRNYEKIVELVEARG